MIMVSFRMAESDAQAVSDAAERLGIDRSQLLRDAVRAYLAHLRAEAEVAAWEAQPLTAEERALAAVSEWGPAEDWSDWLDAAG